MPRVTVVGSLNMDLVLRAPRIPQPGETVIGTSFHIVPGGKGANQAVAAARLGAQVSMVGRVGHDAHADALLKSLHAANVNQTYVIQDAQAATGVALIVVDDAGENSIVVASGANMRLAPADVEAAATAIAAADALILQLEVPLDAITHAAHIAHEHGVTVILNPAPARKVPNDLLRLVDVLIPNEHETTHLTGLPTADVRETAAAATTLCDRGVSTVIITLGKRGALLVHQGEAHTVPAFKVAPVDTTAAGDAFVAGFTVALVEGRTLAESVLWGNAAGALTATRLGAQSSLPTRAQLLDFLDRPTQDPTPC